jgi:hypothetical protein
LNSNWETILAIEKGLVKLSDFNELGLALFKSYDKEYFILERNWNLHKIPFSDIMDWTISWNKLLLIRGCTQMSEKWISTPYWQEWVLFDLDNFTDKTWSFSNQWIKINLLKIFDKSESKKGRRLISLWDWNFIFRIPGKQNVSETLVQISSDWKVEKLLEDKYIYEFQRNQTKIFYSSPNKDKEGIEDDTLHFIDIKTWKTYWPFEKNSSMVYPNFSWWEWNSESESNTELALLWYREDYTIINNVGQTILKSKDINWSLHTDIRNWFIVNLQNNNCSIFNAEGELLWRATIEYKDEYDFPNICVVNNILLIDNRCSQSFNNKETNYKISAFDIYSVDNSWKFKEFTDFEKNIRHIVYNFDTSQDVEPEISILEWKLLLRDNLIKNERYIIDVKSSFSEVELKWKLVEIDQKTFFYRWQDIKKEHSVLEIMKNMEEVKNLDNWKVEIKWKTFNKKMLWIK